MKQLIFAIVVFLFSVSVQAQDNAAAIRQATDNWVSLYQLNEDQSEKAYEIQERVSRQLGEIAALKQSDEKLYLQKKNSIRLGAQASLKRLLNEEQKAIFQEQQIERRKKESALIQQKKEEGASMEAIQLAIWDMD
ncbi:MAG TPA: hypothetical protein PKA00_20315 [Saprospiraceae bacterium]|nr:hypothetical protein [Saprospiraceae bacterium]HMQ85266.1 hypothetical protein [Saprospiraceae bacterium]